MSKHPYDNQWNDLYKRDMPEKIRELQNQVLTDKRIREGLVDYHVVFPEEGSFPLAMFYEKPSAVAWMKQFCPFGTIEKFSFFMKR